MIDILKTYFAHYAISEGINITKKDTDKLAEIAIIELSKQLTSDKITTASFNCFEYYAMEREGFESGAKWVRDKVLKIK